jgi:hypothetical protein
MLSRKAFPHLLPSHLTFTIDNAFGPCHGLVVGQHSWPTVVDDGGLCARPGKRKPLFRRPGCDLCVSCAVCA